MLESRYERNDPIASARCDANQDAVLGPELTLALPNSLSLLTVLYKMPGTDELILFYKVGRDPRRWKGYLKRSDDYGASWSDAEALPHGIVGPAKNKPITLTDGSMLSPSSREYANRVWHVVMERSRDGGRTWETSPPLFNGQRPSAGKVIQPSAWLDDGGIPRLIARSRLTYAVSANATDAGGLTWTPLALQEDVPCPNSGLDAVKLRDGRVLLVYNHSFKKGGWAGRGVLDLAASWDDGNSFHRLFTMEDSKGRNVEFSYPSIVQAVNGLVHIVATFKRGNIKHYTIDPSELPATPPPKKRAKRL